MTYSGNKLLNANNAVLLILVLIFGYAATLATKINGTYPCIAMIAIGILATSNEAFYFEITSSELIVKNYLFPFAKFSYSLNDITEVDILSTNRRSTALARIKIVRSEKVSMGFKGASLDLKEWQALITDLNSKKVPVTVSASRLVDEIGVPE